jgi:hypothetical protein
VVERFPVGFSFLFYEVAQVGRWAKAKVFVVGYGKHYLLLCKSKQVQAQK